MAQINRATMAMPIAVFMIRNLRSFLKFWQGEDEEGGVKANRLFDLYADAIEKSSRPVWLKLALILSAWTYCCGSVQGTYARGGLVLSARGIL